MKQIGIAVLLLFAGIGYAQQSGNSQPSKTNAWGSEYPRVNDEGRVQIRVKAPDAIKAVLDCILNRTIGYI
ncbi:MAG: hypothetical protein P8Z37_05845 [Acidobacteriota bacterium]